MKKIKNMVYENLTPKQRIVANLAAIARSDKDEELRLSKTCPKYTYTMNDHQFCGRLEALQDLSMVVEHDMRNCVLDFFMIGLLYEIREVADFNDLVKAIKESPEYVQEILCIKSAWHEFLQEEGIDIETMDAAYSNLKHPLTLRFIRIGINLGLLSDEHTVAAYKKLLRNYYDHAV